MTQFKQIEVKLDAPISVAVKGQSKECDIVLMTAPSSKNRRDAGRLKRICSKTMMSLASQNKAGEKAEEQESEGLKWDDVIAMLSTASDAPDDLFDGIYDSFLGLLSNGCGSVEGVAINETIFDKFSLDDVEHLLGEYVVNFLLGFLDQKKNGKK
jgi:hypothetical protein